ncbi:NUDIX hydrolase [Halobacillus mangrovi]|uniref:NUDIX hydrolase n=1 Tax=Halobacillus mangrovi TaxID=402384 RepID=UPI003D995B39
MRPETIIEKMKQHTPSILGQQSLTKFSILLPFVEKDDELHLLFEVRSHQMRRQPGEICFPGGRVDREDQKEKDTAIRETMEELGVDEEDLSQVFPFDYMVSPFGMRIYTYVGFIDKEEADLVPNPAEVEEVFTVPLSFFLENDPEVYRVNFEVKPEENFPFDLIPGGRNYEWSARQFEEYFYNYEDKVIWGLTARVLYHFVEMMRN